MSDLFKRKPLDLLMTEASETGEHCLRRALGPVNLITLGIGAIIGAGIFVLTGSAAAKYAGPAIVLSFVLSGIACIFAGLCYAEFSSLIPIAGSAYTYGYATLGEIFAWIIGWDLILEYAFGAATVASGWSGYVLSFLQDFGIRIPARLTAAPSELLISYNGHWEHYDRVQDTLIARGIDSHTLPQVTGLLNLGATILVIGIKESANFNSGIVIVKLAIVLMFIGIAGLFAIKHSSLVWA